VLLKVAYLFMFGLIALVFRGDRAKDAELLVLRRLFSSGLLRG
jgi:hypothetical protein